MCARPPWKKPKRPVIMQCSPLAWTCLALRTQLVYKNTAFILLKGETTAAGCCICGSCLLCLFPWAEEWVFLTFWVLPIEQECTQHKVDLLSEGQCYPSFCPSFANQCEPSSAHQDTLQGPANNHSQNSPSGMSQACTISGAISHYMGKCGFERAV